MDTRKATLKKAFYRSGFNDLLSFTTAFRGPLNYRYQGWRGILYRIYVTLVDIITAIMASGIIARFLLPGISLSERCLTGFPAMIVILMLFKTVYYYYNRVAFENLLLEYEACFPNDEFKLQMDGEVNKYSKMFRPVIISITVSIIVTQMPWCFLSFINEIQGKPRALAVPVTLPIDIYSNTYLFLAACLNQTYTAYTIPVKNVAFDDIFYCYCCRQLALFSHLEKSLDRLLHRHYPLNATGDRPKFGNAERDFINWAKNHQQTLRLMQELQRLFSPVLFVYFGLITLSMCMNAFIISLGDLNAVEKIFCGIFAGTTSLGLLFYCRVGDLITYKSSKMNDAFLGKFTALATKREHRILKIIITRCQVANTLSAFGVFYLNSDTFQSIMMSTYSYYTLLKEIKN